MQTSYIRDINKGLAVSHFIWYANFQVPIECEAENLTIFNFRIDSMSVKTLACFHSGRLPGLQCFTTSHDKNVDVLTARCQFSSVLSSVSLLAEHISIFLGNIVRSFLSQADSRRVQQTCISFL